MKAVITIDGIQYTARYDRARCSLQGFDSQSDFYAIYVANEQAIERAAGRADDATHDLSDSDLPNGSTSTITTKSGSVISVTLYPKFS